MLALGPAGCGGESTAGARPGGEAAAPIDPLVEAVQAREGSLPLVEQVTGTLRARNQVAIRPEVQGRIVDVLVRDGDAVEQDQPLVRLEPVSVTSQLRQARAGLDVSSASADAARARLAELEAQVVRTRKLAKQGLVSQLELETQEAQFAAAGAAAEQARASIAAARATVAERRDSVQKTVVRAPVAGRIGQRNAEVGMRADSSTVLFMVGDITELIVEVPLGEEMLAHVREGQTVHVRSPAVGGEPRTAKLSRISPFLTPGSFSTTAEIDLDNPQEIWRPGMFVTVDILYGESQRATLVPLSALWEDPKSGRFQVFVLDGVPTDGDDPAEARPFVARDVEVVAHGHDTIGVSGIEPNEWVVTVGQFMLAEHEGDHARVRPTTWERVLVLQSRQQEDLLQDFLDKQQRLARTRGARPPSTDDLVAGK